MNSPPRGLRFALQLAARGYRVFPVAWPSRVPLLKDWPNRASSDPLEIEAMWGKRQAVVGIAAGPILVVDIDEKDGRKGIEKWNAWCAENGVHQDEFTQTTLSGGVHQFYSVPSGVHLGNSSGSLPSGIDIRCEAGFAFAYELLPEVSELPPVPEALLEALKRPEPRPRRSTSAKPRDPSLGVHPYAERAIGYELDRLDACASGEADLWNNTVYAVSANLIEFSNSNWSGYSLEQAHADLFEHAPQDPGFGPNEIQKCWESALQKVGDADREEPEGQYLSAQEVFDEWIEEAQHRIFDATPILQHIRQAAHSRMLGSGAVLANVLGRVLAEVPPGVVLPPTIGSAASLNLGFAMVGQSGDGKSATFKCGAEILGLNQKHLETGVGSGEGLIESFLEEQSIPDPRDPTKSIRVKGLVTPPSRIFHVDEIEQLTKASGREGATIMSILRTALTGGAMKSANATVERRRSVDSETYRLVTYLGVQPTKSGPLLNEADAGTPQRLLWISTVDKTVPLEKPEWPGSLDWAGMIIYANQYEVKYPQHIKDMLEKQRYDRVHGKGDPLESHLMLTRLKVAAALAFLHDEMDITDQWWTLSGYLMDWSKKEQDRCRAVLDEVGSAAARSRGRTSVVEEEAAEAARTDAVKERIRQILRKGESTWTQIHDRLSPKQRERLESAVSELSKAGEVAVEAIEARGRRIRKLRLARSTKE